MENQNTGSNHFIYLAVAAVNIITFTSGGCFSWASPILPKLSSTDPAVNPLPRPATTLEKSWIAAIMTLGAVVGSLAGGVCSEKFGKKKTLLLLGVPMVISHLLCAFAVKVHFFLIARFLIGIGVGTVYGVVPAYVGDIAEDRNRGLLGSVFGVANCTGILFMYIIGPFLSVRIVSLINVIPIVLFYVLFGYYIPGSPYDLIKQGNRKAAEESLMKLRNKKSEQIEKDIACIIETTKANERLQYSSFFSIFRSKTLTKGLIISNGLMFFQQFSGICAVLGYMQTIFESAGSSIPSDCSAMLVGIIQLISNIASTQLVDRTGRKILLIISCIFSIISLLSLGAYFHLKVSGKNVDNISWIPVSSLIVYVTAYNFGLANMPWVFLTELFPANVKALASTITSFFCLSLTFLVTMCFPYLSATIGMAGSFWTFAAVLTAGLTFFINVVPETKGRSSQEIQNILEGVQK